MNTGIHHYQRGMGAGAPVTSSAGAAVWARRRERGTDRPGEVPF